MTNKKLFPNKADFCEYNSNMKRQSSFYRLFLAQAFIIFRYFLIFIRLRLGAFIYFLSQVELITSSAKNIDSNHNFFKSEE